MSGIYIHIPFCKQACHYCNFHFTTSLWYKNELIAALLKEIGRVENITGVADSIYFGGGTPSLLEAGELADILAALRHRFGWTGDAEITLEANPDDITDQRVKEWEALGINRLSIGVQSFFEEDLRWMNRAHNAGQAIESLRVAQRVIPNITLDLIYGSPGLTDEKWRSNIEQALALGITHLSCYALTVEPRTRLEKMIRQQQSADVDDEQQSRQFRFLMQYLRQQGWEHYEISNFALPGHRSRHNSSYWRGQPYLGLGPGAHSFDGQKRWWNVPNNNQYIEALEKGQFAREEELLTVAQRWNEYLMIRLRTIEGIDLDQLPDWLHTGAMEKNWLRFEKAAAELVSSGRMMQEGRRFWLSDEGRLYADGIAADFFDVD